MTLTRDSFIAKGVGYAGMCDFSQFNVAIVAISNLNVLLFACQVPIVREKGRRGHIQIIQRPFNDFYSPKSTLYKGFGFEV